MYEGADNNSAVSPADMEQASTDALGATEEITRFNRPVVVRVHSIRKRLTDADGVSSKYIIDAIVDAEILQDDGPEEVAEVVHTQEKTKDEDLTIITITGVA